MVQPKGALAGVCKALPTFEPTRKSNSDEISHPPGNHGLSAARRSCGQSVPHLTVPFPLPLASTWAEEPAELPTGQAAQGCLLPAWPQGRVSTPGGWASHPRGYNEGGTDCPSSATCQYRPATPCTPPETT